MTNLGDPTLHLAAIVSSSHDAITSEDLASNITTWNAGAERLYGYTATEAIGQPARFVVADEQHEQEASVMARVRSGQSVEPFETERLVKGGGRVHVSVTISPVRTQAGEIAGVSTIARSVAPRIELERDMFRLAAIVDSSDDAIVSKSLDGIILTWNRAAEQMFGYTADEAIGKSIRIIIPPDRQNEEDDVLARVRSGVAVNHFETVRQRKDGSFLDISVTVSPIRSRAGIIIGASKIARDITAQKRLGRELEEAGRMKDEFLATLSHELRTPLNAVMGYTRMWRSGMVTDARREQVVDIIERNASILSRLVSDVLDMSSIVTGKVRLFVEPCNLADIVHAAVETVRPSAEAKGLTLRVIGDAEQFAYRCDGNRMHQVFWNLISNAVKFTPDGGSVEVRLTRAPTHIQAIVSDTGIGIQPDFLPYVFQRFRQGESGIGRRYGGLGLGLALVRHFVELHGGQVSAMSDGDGRGSTFRITLPTFPPLSAAERSGE